MPSTETSPLVLADVLRDGGIRTYFQPIACVKKRATVGLEGLARGVRPGSGEIITPNTLFRLAEQENLELELDRRCRSTALSSFQPIMAAQQELILFLNVHTGTMEQDRTGPDDILEQARRFGIHPENIAIEILESHIDSIETLRKIVEAYRTRGFLVALDDFGAGYSNLNRVPVARPDLLKIDRSIIQGIDENYHQQEVFKALVNLARKIGALVIAEGVETHGEALRVSELGADMIQGFYLARPGQTGPEDLAQLRERIETVARSYKAYMVGKINTKKLSARRYNIIINTLLCDLSREMPEGFDPTLSRMIGEHTLIECAYVLDEAGMQVSNTICNARVASEGGQLFRPAPKGADHSLKEYYYVLLDVEFSKYTTEPYVSLASGSLCRTISTLFRDAANKMHVLCVDVRTDGAG